jgi:hypothetical protein
MLAKVSLSEVPHGAFERGIAPVPRETELGGVKQTGEVWITPPVAMDLKGHPLEGWSEKGPPGVERRRSLWR